MALSLKQLDY